MICKASLKNTAFLSVLSLGLFMSPGYAQQSKYDFDEAKQYERAEEFAVVMTWHQCRLTPELVKTELPKAGFHDEKEIAMSKEILKKEGRLVQEGQDLVLKGAECMPQEEVRSILLSAFAKHDCRIDFHRFRQLTKTLGVDRALAQDEIQRMLKSGDATVEKATNQLMIKESVCVSE